VTARFPLPDVDWEPTREFWAGAARKELCLPRCTACTRIDWYPTGRCRHCGADDVAWVAVSGRGTLFSWTVVRHVLVKQYAGLVPYATGLVSIDEDPAVRIVTRLVDCRPEELCIGMPMRAVFRPLEFEGVEGTVMAPMFAPA
jgi:uncharacterized OB-fold protein